MTLYSIEYFFMCGIAGMFTFVSENLNLDYFSWCRSTMRRRGPDAEGMWHNHKNYVTVFTRLAIRDLSVEANQPMHSECGKYVISFNGELYNTGDITQALQPYRQHFRTTSDTEILLYALQYLGVDKTLGLADGMFAFAFYDQHRNRLVLARDRVGIKPLYVGSCNSGVVYSSQYDHIINHDFFRDQPLDEQVLATYLHVGYVPGGMGIVQQTYSLPQGHFLTVADGKTELKRYYRYCIENKATTKFAQPGSLESVITASVSSQLVSDVPVGTFMSGGTDSTLVSYFANTKQPVSSFTIGIKDHVQDETAAAALYAQRFHLKHYSKYITPADMLQLLQDNTAAYSEPFADISSIPTLLLSAFAKEKVTVALSGDGPDELFWGYPRSLQALSVSPYYRPTFPGKHIRLLQGKISHPKTLHVSRHWHSGGFADYYYSTLFLTGALQYAGKLVKARPAIPGSVVDAADTLAKNGASEIEVMRVIRQLEIDIHLPRILLKVDRASMFHSLEVRVPWLSNDMLAYSSSIDWHECIQGNQGKANVKALLVRHSGAEPLLKEKHGFRIPLDEWMRRELKQEITGTILSMSVHLADLFHRKQLEQVLATHMSGKADLSWLIWAVYTLVKWDAFHRNKYRKD